MARAARAPRSPTWTGTGISISSCAAMPPPNRLYRNEDGARFREVARESGLAHRGSSRSAAFADHDRDGDLDLFVVTGDGEEDLLYQNDGHGLFAHASQRAGLIARDSGVSATWWDPDGDGWPDLYVANDPATTDRRYRNRRDGTFEDLGCAAIGSRPAPRRGRMPPT